MKIRARRCGTAIVLDLQGQLAVADDMKQLQRLATSLMTAPFDTLVLNLESVSRVDCTGIGELVRLRRAVQSSGAALRLVNVAPRLRRMLEMVGLLKVLAVCDTLDEALQRNVSAPRPVVGSLSVDAV